MRINRIFMLLLWSAAVVCLGSAAYAAAPVNMRTVEEGAYYVSAVDIGAESGMKKADVIALIKTRKLSLTNRGIPVAYLPSADSKGIYFYGEKLQSIYSDMNVYSLKKADGQVMGVRKGMPPAPADGNGTFTDTVHFEQDNWALTGTTFDPESDYWQWDYLVAGNATLGTKPFPIDVRGVSDGSHRAKLTIRMLGVTATGKPLEHHVVAKLNGTKIGEAQWDGMTWKNMETEFDQGLLTEGSNTVELTALKDAGIPYSTVYLGSMDLEYARSYRAVNGQLLLRGDSNPVITVSGFTNAAISVLNLAVTGMPAVLEGVTIDQANGDYRASFVPATPQTPYLVFDRSNGKTTVSMDKDVSSGLKTKSNKYQYLVITARPLANGAQRLASYRNKQGLKSRVVFLDQIYDEFNYGIESPMAIKEFLSYARRNWAKPPEFVVLAGDGTYDYKDHRGFGDCVVPAIMIGTQKGLFVSDMKYADVNNDGVPEIAVGRLTVMTDDELQMIVSRIIAYEAAPSSDWQKGRRQKDLQTVSCRDSA